MTCVHFVGRGSEQYEVTCNPDLASQYCHWNIEELVDIRLASKLNGLAGWDNPLSSDLLVSVYLLALYLAKAREHICTPLLFV